jgi:hypothetical protein
MQPRREARGNERVSLRRGRRVARRALRALKRRPEGGAPCCARVCVRVTPSGRSYLVLFQNATRSFFTRPFVRRTSAARQAFRGSRCAGCADCRVSSIVRRHAFARRDR